MEPIKTKTGMMHAEAREFMRNHFEEFVNKKNVQIGKVNFAADFVDHLLMCRTECHRDQRKRFNT